MLDSTGTVLSDSFIKGEYFGPEKVMKDIASMVKASPDTTVTAN